MGTGGKCTEAVCFTETAIGARTNCSQSQTTKDDASEANMTLGQNGGTRLGSEAKSLAIEAKGGAR